MFKDYIKLILFLSPLLLNMTSQIQVELNELFNQSVYFSNNFPDYVVCYVVCPTKQQLTSNDFLHILKEYSVNFEYFEQDVICLFKLSSI
jgi:hypothetical protein